MICLPPRGPIEGFSLKESFALRKINNLLGKYEKDFNKLTIAQIKEIADQCEFIIQSEFKLDWIRMQFNS